MTDEMQMAANPEPVAPKITKNQTLTINGEQVIVYKLPLYKYSQALKAIQELPKHMDLVEGKSGQEIMANLPTIVAVVLPDVIRIVKIVTNVTDEEEIVNWGLDDLVNILIAAYEVNNYGSIYERIKKVTARPKN